MCAASPQGRGTWPHHTCVLEPARATVSIAVMSLCPSLRPDRQDRAHPWVLPALSAPVHHGTCGHPPTPTAVSTTPAPFLEVGWDPSSTPALSAVGSEVSRTFAVTFITSLVLFLVTPCWHSPSCTLLAPALPGSTCLCLLSTGTQEQSPMGDLPFPSSRWVRARRNLCPSNATASPHPTAGCPGSRQSGVPEEWGSSSVGTQQSGVPV